ncbi:hypothetical protein GCM10010515_24800 [Streptomyces fructofermentans]|uniref:Uncharacterized protein n=1 Tax=Streptomyces fructofermentans TaxID=152141 RepID=A0A918NBW4_9ACTN|nr:hypothetical protein GCM10010515_24800 [Streptomyces fructofermentans]
MADTAAVTLAVRPSGFGIGHALDRGERRPDSSPVRSLPGRSGRLGRYGGTGVRGGAGRRLLPYVPVQPAVAPRGRPWSREVPMSRRPVAVSAPALAACSRRSHEGPASAPAEQAVGA